MVSAFRRAVGQTIHKGAKAKLSNNRDLAQEYLEQDVLFFEEAKAKNTKLSSGAEKLSSQIHHANSIYHSAINTFNALKENYTGMLIDNAISMRSINRHFHGKWSRSSLKIERHNFEKDNPNANLSALNFILFNHTSSTYLHEYRLTGVKLLIDLVENNAKLMGGQVESIAKELLLEETNIIDTSFLSSNSSVLEDFTDKYYGNYFYDGGGLSSIDLNFLNSTRFNKHLFRNTEDVISLFNDCLNSFGSPNRFDQYSLLLLIHYGFDKAFSQHYLIHEHSSIDPTVGLPKNDWLNTIRKAKQVKDSLQFLNQHKAAVQNCTLAI